MTHYGIIVPGAVGHLNPMCALALELRRRNHSVTLFGVADIETMIANTGLNFSLIGEREFPLGALDKKYKDLGKMTGREARKCTIQLIAQGTTMLFDSAPEAIRSAEINALIVDQVSFAGGTIADRLDLPYVSVCNALLLNREIGVPPAFTHWSYSKAWWALLRNEIGNLLIDHTSRSIWKQIQKQRQRWKLPLYKKPDESYSKLAQICQLPLELDFPRKKLPKHFHYTGPLHDPSGEEPISFLGTPFPWEKLTDKPLIYASLGTLQNKLPEIFQCIAAATAALDVQLVISLGDPNDNPSDYGLPGSAIAVSFAPHQKLIDKSSAVVTHAGMNTTLAALRSGVPIVAIPITNEQPGIATRIARTGAGKVLPIQSLTVSRLRAAIESVLTDDSYKRHAVRLQQVIRRSGGVRRAADIVEQAYSFNKPVVA
jgi:zeaxanthin glucosyltransferase